MLHGGEVAGVAVLELPDGAPAPAGIALGGRVRTKNETLLEWQGRPLTTWRRTWT